MNDNENITMSKLPSRRKFVWSVGMVSLFAAVSAAVRFPFLNSKNAIAGKSKVKNKTITMLTQDGRLVQIDEALITANRKKATDHEIQNWIKK